MNHRRGTTLIEIGAMLLIASIAFSGAFAVLTRLQHVASDDHPDGTRAEQACALLRRDLSAGTVRREGANLHIAIKNSDIMWSSNAGELLRNDRILLHAATFTVVEADGRLTVTITPTGLPPRRIEVQR
ncbi:MAG: hypothetical protein AAB263_06575 [Planctomycetota bacterium]